MTPDEARLAEAVDGSVDESMIANQFRLRLVAEQVARIDSHIERLAAYLDSGLYGPAERVQMVEEITNLAKLRGSFLAVRDSLDNAA